MRQKRTLLALTFKKSPTKEFFQNLVSKESFVPQGTFSIKLTLFKMGFSGLFTDGGGKKTSLLKICHTYPTMMKLGKVILTLRRSKKYVNHIKHLLSSAVISISSPEICNFRYTKEYKHRLHFNIQFLILLSLFESLKVVLINMASILMMSARFATLGLSKTEYFEIKVMTSSFLFMTSQQNFIT